jgi:hypothetical protein
MPNAKMKTINTSGILDKPNAYLEKARLKIKACKI